MNPGDRVEFTTGVKFLNQEMQWINLFNDLIGIFHFLSNHDLWGQARAISETIFGPHKGDNSLMNNFYIYYQLSTILKTVIFNIS